MSNVEEHTQAMRHLRYVIENLRGYAQAFLVVGNQTMCRTLKAEADDLEVIKETCENAFNTETQRAYEYAREGSTNMLRAVLAVTTIKQEE